MNFQLKPQSSISKLLVLMRHAKTESPYSLKRDFDRSLTTQGEQDARQMGAWLKAQSLSIDAVLSSTAKRTRQTTDRIAEQIGLNPSAINYLDDLYHAQTDVFFKTICTVPDEIQTLLIVSHNDGITHFANMLTDARIDYMQPGSVFIVKSDCETWESFKESEREFVLYKQPGK
jgi:phosphohistidine phosphatase